MRGLLDNRNYRPQFAGHETFALRYGWLKKAFDAVRGAESRREDAEAVFSADGGIALFGVGRNMVASLRHWALATGVVEPGEFSGLSTTGFGRAVFGVGGDPFLESKAALWLLHWRLAALPRRAAAWYWLFSEMNEPSFDRDLLATRLSRRVAEVRDRGRAREFRVSDGSLKRDVDCLIRTYLSRQGGRGLVEDSMECPLAELGLVSQVGASMRLARGPKPSLPDEVFLYGLVSFWRESAPERGEFGIESVCHGPGSPGRVFLLDEESVAARLAAMEELTAGALRWDEGAGLRQVYAPNLAAVDPLAAVEKMFGAINARRIGSAA